MTDQEYMTAFMDGAMDAWKLARTHRDCLDAPYLMVKGAILTLAEIEERDDERDNADGNR